MCRHWYPGRHFRAELPVEDRCRRPVPSTSFLATLGFTDCGAPFRRSEAAVQEGLFHCRRPSPSRAPSRVRQASSHTSCSSHCFNRRQQVAGEGYLLGRKRHAAPVCSTHRMASRQARLDAHERPRLALRRFGSGSSGAISSHCASVNTSNRFLLMQEVHPTTSLKHKSTA